MKNFAKALLIGNIFVIAVWIVTVLLFWWRSQVDFKNRGIQGLTAMAGGWAYWLHKPSIIILLAVAFGCGVYFSTRFWS